jgi:ankyrin repeat protein
MKTFFDKLGKLGEILAPVTGTQNPFFIAIQNHNNVDVQSLLLNSPDTDMARANENGYSAIHCACRYNNMFAIDLIMSRGESRGLSHIAIFTILDAQLCY